MTNQAQREVWNNENQTATWPKRERLTTTVTAPLLELLALRPGERIIDVGCGGGLAAIEAPRAVAPSGAVTGFDISVPLIKMAGQRATDSGVKNVRFFAGDAQTDGIPGAPFDVAMSQFGVMFFADPVEAFRNIRRHLRPGGRIGFACWQPAAKNGWFPGPVLAAYQTPPAANAGTGPPPGPFAFGDADRVGDILRDAGFAEISHQERTFDVVVPEDSIFDRGNLDAMKLEPAQSEQAWRDLQAFAASMRGDDGQLHLRLAPQLFGALNPS
ncbi:MAG: class I SAM-dependent methyltransferase [Chloroflexota bacterium]|nr:class I SAM-dependent methyltransferase [Chloroflexota bacterium]